MKLTPMESNSVTHNKEGETFELAKVDLEELVKAHHLVSTYAEGAVMTIPELGKE